MLDNLKSNELNIFPDLGLLINDNPETIVAGLPTTLIATALETQLKQTITGYSDVDYLSTILDSCNLLKQRLSGNADTLSALDSSLRKIFSRVLLTIETEFDVNFTLNSYSQEYFSDILELYQFFVINRKDFGKELLFNIISNNKKNLIDRYRKDTEKKNQTIAEARKVFSSFDDVIIFVSIPQILEDFNQETNWSLNLKETLAELDLTDSKYFSEIFTSLWNPEDFAIRYCQPLFHSDNISNLEIYLQDEWLAYAPKKTEQEGNV
jgi:hypothetical protein